jgi:nicotinamidase-related amidase
MAPAVGTMDRLSPASTALLVVDVQERLAPAMPPARMDALTRNVGILLDAASHLKVRVLASEQYPKGLGHTLPPLSEKLAAAGVHPIAKTTFDACGDPGIARALAAMAPRAVVVVGMETHVCVFQTVRELSRRGYEVHVVVDAVASRTEENRAAGIALCERAGAVPTTTETVVFDWLERAGTEAFRVVSKLVK